jgi:hypothetical protein
VRALDKLKIIELIISAGSALLSAAKYIIKFIDYLFKLKGKPTAAAA